MLPNPLCTESMDILIKVQKMRRKVCVIGLGVVGHPTAEYISQHGFDVFGYDIRPKISENFSTTTDWNKVPKDVEIYVIAVPTGSEKGKPDLTNLYDVCDKISNTNSNSLVCMESTVPAGTCRKLAEKFGLSNVVHVPHRYWQGDPVNRGVKMLRVFGALNSQSSAIGLDFYKKLEIPLHIVPEIEIAEMCKIAENAYTYVRIAFVEGLRMICEDLGLDFNKVRDACNTKWNIDLLEARDGIWGYCLPKDIRYLLNHSNSDPLLVGAIRTDARYKKKFGPKKQIHKKESQI